MKTLKLYINEFGISGIKYYYIKKFRFPSQIKVPIPGGRAPVTLRPRTSDMDVFQQVFVEKEYLFELEKLPEIIVDAGANIGLTSVYYAIQYPNARIIAIEPEDSNFELLKENTSAYPNVLAIQKALWYTQTHLSFVDPEASKFSFRVEETEKAKGISAITMEDLLEKYELDYIDILKMDIEGAEKEVFSHDTDWLSKTGLIAIELHDYLKEGCSKAFERAVAPYLKRQTQIGENIFARLLNERE